MFLNAPPNPSRLKHIAYLIVAATIGFLISLLASIGIVLLRGHHLLPFAAQIIILAAGPLVGFAVGRLWWRKVYIERTWAERVRFNKGK